VRKLLINQQYSKEEELQKFECTILRALYSEIMNKQTLKVTGTYNLGKSGCE